MQGDSIDFDPYFQYMYNGWTAAKLQTSLQTNSDLRPPICVGFACAVTTGGNQFQPVASLSFEKFTDSNNSRQNYFIVNTFTVIFIGLIFIYFDVRWNCYIFFFVLILHMRTKLSDYHYFINHRGNIKTYSELFVKFIVAAKLLVIYLKRFLRVLLTAIRLNDLISRFSGSVGFQSLNIPAMPTMQCGIRLFLTVDCEGVNIMIMHTCYTWFLKQAEKRNYS